MGKVTHALVKRNAPAVDPHKKFCASRKKITAPALPRAPGPDVHLEGPLGGCFIP